MASAFESTIGSCAEVSFIGRRIRNTPNPGVDMTDSLERMIQSYTSRLIEHLQDTKQIADRTGDLFQRGRECGFYLALTMLAIRAKSFGVDLRMIGLGDINTEELI